MKYRSVFDIIGPVMIGPSSSHTAGAVRIGQLARKLFGRAPQRAEVHFFGSFARTYKGHATDVAVLAGILGYESSDPRIPDALAIAERAGLEVRFLAQEAVPQHPNTVTILLESGETRFRMTGISVGGGMVQVVEVDGFELRLSGDSPALLIFHKDAYGAVASVTQLLAYEHININHMEVSRSHKGQTALMVIETDEQVAQAILDLIGKQPHIQKIVKLDV
ncbi:MAG: L-serine ammonia-lyase, iron-sulfur-dependent subunit beta [Christensenellales bacterium]